MLAGVVQADGKKVLILTALVGLLATALVALAVREGLRGPESDPCPPSKFEGAALYGQLYEDYIVDYVFHDVARGAYLDIGANHPFTNNTTARLYERGWRGITIEPNPDFIPLYQQLRPGEPHLSIGIGNADGKLTFFRVEARDGFNMSGLSTFNPEEAGKLKTSGYSVTELPVEVMTVNRVLERHPLGHIEFVNIDVEGFETAVLQGFDLRRYRPVVMALEATEPQSERPNHQKWEKIILQSGYVFAMFDGLNRYYLHRDRDDLLPRFVHIDMCVKRSKLARKVKLDGWQPY